jgi:3-oxoadipate enol-lactonase
MADYADDANALLNAVGWDTCQVIGVSFGGMVAQEFAIRYPQRVERLILSCTSSGGGGGASYPLHELANLSLEDWTRRVIELSDLRRDAAWQAANPNEFQAIVAETLTGLKLGADEPGHAMGARRQVEARKGHDTYDRLSTLSMPVFIAGGRYDGIAEPRNKLAMLQQIASAQMELFEGGHLYFLQDPRAFECMTAFFKGERDSLRGEVTTA